MKLIDPDQLHAGRFDEQIDIALLALTHQYHSALA